jgi:hypothetical protein
MSEKKSPKGSKFEKEKEGGEKRPQLDGLWKVPMFGGL